eukprot:TRINITY_DN10089_c0_g1_i2.p1 TRINITY_DN10089_c0_g1~~TRINITY_DN10089_c0_g1_i2.p1  ORF type:complete len:1364 (+),score=206.38 TRINITY_DN10089_c0_g1_i2:44-4135(+)
MADEGADFKEQQIIENDNFLDFIESRRLNPQKWESSEGRTYDYCEILIDKISVEIPKTMQISHASDRLCIQLSVFLYSATTRSVQSNLWTSETRDVPKINPAPMKKTDASAGDRVVVPIEQRAFFYTSQGSGDIEIIAEAVLLVMGHDSPQGVAVSRVSVGWCAVSWRLNQRGGGGWQIAQSGSHQRGIELLRGSPRVLFLKNTKGKFIKTNSKSVIFLSARPADYLSEIQHAFQENEIIGAQDYVVGVEINDKTGRQMLLRPLPILSNFSFNMERLVVLMDPTFDESLIISLKTVSTEEDATNREGLHISIENRRLRAGIHNGRTFLQKPTTIELRKYKDRLLFDGSLEFSKVAQEEGCAVIFQLEYVFRISIVTTAREQKGKTSLVAQQAVTQIEKTFPVGWGLHSILPTHYRYQPRQSVQFFTGPGKSFDMQNMIASTSASPNINLSFDVNVIIHRKKPVSQKVADSATLTSPLAQTQPLSDSISEHPSEPSTERKIDQQPEEEPKITPKLPQQTILEEPPREEPVHEEAPPRFEAPPVEEVLEEDAYRSQFISEETVIGPLMSRPISMHTKDLTRATKARLFQSGFADILDALNNRPLEVSATVSEGQRARIDPLLELKDAMQINELVFQFMAFEPVLGATDRHLPTNLYFTIQFYHFPLITTDRVFLKSVTSDATGPYAIRRYMKDGGVDVAGLQVRYIVDPSLMRVDEVAHFTDYMTNKIISIGVWDDDSLLPLGIVHIDPAFLLRQQRASVICLHEFDIIEHQGMFVVDLPSSRQDVLSIKGKLLLRIANIGKVGEAPSSSNKPPEGMQQVQQKNRVVARPLVETEPELAAIIGVAEDPSGKGAALKSKRIQIAKMISEDPHSKAGLDVKTTSMRRLKLVQMYRDSRRTGMIRSFLSEKITKTYCLYPSLGVSHFIEYQFQNPYPEDMCIMVKYDDPELRLVTDVREWAHLKKINNLITPIEENMFADGFKLFIGAMEKVYIPFLFQSFCSGRVLQYPYPSQATNRPTFEGVDPLEKPILARSVKISFCIEENRPIGAPMASPLTPIKEVVPVEVLDVQVIPQPFIVDRTYRFSCGEHEFFKQSIVFSGQRSNHSGRVYVVCSNKNVFSTVNTSKRDNTEYQEVFFKYRTAAAPQIGRFFLMIYADSYCTKILEIWEIIVHSLLRRDMDVIAGQTSKASISLRGSGTTRDVQCFSSDPSHLSIHPNGRIYLVPNSHVEINLSVKPMAAETRNIYVNVVDVANRYIFSAWMIKVTSRLPAPNKTFEVSLPYDVPSSKKIKYMNQYQTTKTFTLTSNMPHLLHFKEPTIEIPAGETKYIGLKFEPSRSMNTVDILVFLNDEEDKTEECLCIVANYTST